jgi:hypothetical protein
MFNILHLLTIPEMNVACTAEYIWTWMTLFPHFFYPASYTILTIPYLVTEAQVTVANTHIKQQTVRHCIN